MSGNLTNLLSASQNIVTALNNNAQTTLQIAGNKNSTGISVQTVVSANPGRVAVVSVTTLGTSPSPTSGSVYDAASITTATASRLLVTIPATVGIYVINMPVAYGIVVTPGTNMTVSVSYS